MKLLSLSALVLMVGLGFWAGSALAASNSSTATTNASATIVSPIVLTKINDLTFGSLMVAAPGGTINSMNGSLTGSGITIVSSATPASDATFSVTGQSSAAYTINVPATIDVISSGGVTNDTALSVLNGTSRSLTSGGTGSFEVKGILTLSGTETPGTYTTSFPTTVTYQ